MRKLTDHKLNGLNDALEITVLDEPGQGGACHKYLITLPDWSRNPDGSAPHHVWNIDFQNGPVSEAGFNGLSGEALLAIVIDRLRNFQAGPYSCRENALAMDHAENALHWLNKRTRDRLSRGVEGTDTK